MNSEVHTAPCASALDALVPFVPKHAFIQLQLWTTAAAKALSASLNEHRDLQEIVGDEEEALERTRAKVREARGFKHEPEWCMMATVLAQKAVRDAKRIEAAAWDTCQANKADKLRALEMMRTFLEQHPEFQQVTQFTGIKRKRSTADDSDDSGDSDDSADSRSSKRQRSTASPPSTEHASRLQTWRDATKSAFKDRAAMKAFPEPVAWPCSNLLCPNQDKTDRALSACECNIKAALNGLAEKELNKERQEFHPDRFAVCRGEKRELWQRMATEVFTSISSMLIDSDEANAA